MTVTEIREALGRTNFGNYGYQPRSEHDFQVLAAAARAYADLLENGEKVYFAEKVAMPDSDSGDDAIWTFIVPGSYLIVHLGGGVTMIDQLRQALAFYGDPDSYTGHEEIVLQAARAWSEFPTDVQVEAAAAELYELTGEDGDMSWEANPDEDTKRFFRLCASNSLNAALEAAHNTGGPTQ